ncbi:MAG TPA: DUF6785 family protein [Tepidisphaeraceae bacterium]|jgi:hypothetical protein
MESPPLSPDDVRAPALTLRSILIGLAGVCFVCGVAPYNDFAMENTLLIGNFLPIGLLLIVLLLVLGVNVPLRWFAPRLALRQGELAVIILMVLVSCSLPSSGLMRYLPGSFIGIYNGAAERPTEWGAAVDAARLPDWLLPRLDGVTAADKGADNVITSFYSRAPDGVVPWAAWVRPFIAWGILVALLWGLLIFLSLIVRKQWAENERLSFPLATIYQSLIEAPAHGHVLNALFRSVGFWVAAGSVFVLHSINALHAYDRGIPSIPLYYDFQDMLVDPPWSYTYVTFKTASISFSMIGIAFFIQTKTAFSLWFFFILWQVEEVLFGTAGISTNDAMIRDQTFGGLIVFSALLIYVGRHHWAMVVRHMFARRRPTEDGGLYLSYAVTGWGAAICFTGILAWLWLAGVSVGAGLVITLVTVMLFMVCARVLADTGLMFVQLNFPLIRTFYYPVLMPPTPYYTSQTNFFFSGWFTELFHDLRESIAGYFQLGVRVADESINRRDRPRRVGYGLLAAVVLALGVGYVVSWASMLKVEYAYAQTTSSPSITPNIYGVENAVRANILEPAAAYQAQSLTQGGRGPLGEPLWHVAAGAAVVGVCSVLRLVLPWWPLHPIGFVVVYSYAMQKIWFSIMIGWAAKVVVLRLGGSTLLRQGRSTFIGLIVGEAFAAAFWLVVNVILHARGFEYKPMLFTPG